MIVILVGDIKVLEIVTSIAIVAVVSWKPPLLHEPDLCRLVAVL